MYSYSSLTTSEECILQQEAALVAVVQVLREVLGRHNEREAVRAGIEQILDQLDGNEAGGATHA